MKSKGRTLWDETWSKMESCFKNRPSLWQIPSKLSVTCLYQWYPFVAVCGFVWPAFTAAFPFWKVDPFAGGDVRSSSSSLPSSINWKSLEPPKACLGWSGEVESWVGRASYLLVGGFALNLFVFSFGWIIVVLTSGSSESMGEPYRKTHIFRLCSLYLWI